MHQVTRGIALGLLATVLLAPLASRTAAAYVDTNLDKIDDRIASVHTNGWNAAFVNNDPAQKMRIGVSNPAAIVYAVYVGYNHRPTVADQSLLSGTGVTMVWPFQSVDVIETRATWSQVQAIAALPGVTRVEAIEVEYALNHYSSRVLRARDSRGLTAAENYALYPSARDLGLDGEGIVIAILDTGVNDDVDQANPGYAGHESVRGKFLGGGEFWCGQPQCATANNASANPQDHGAEASSYHATHVAGSAMGTGGPGGYFAGIAPKARLVDCKVLSDAGASVGGSNRGLDWVIANRLTLWAGLLPGSPYQGIDVVSMSLGSTECATGSGTSTGTGSTLINTAVASGLVVVIATGNDGATECIASPAAADGSIAVGASEHKRTLDRSDDVVTDFSNEGPRDDDGDADHNDEMKPSVVAPGAGIISADGDPTSDGTSYKQLSGTSMACPMVSGCVALLLQANPLLSPAQIRSILQNTAEHNVPSVKGADRGQDPYGIDINYDPACGWGLVDVYAAAKEAINSTSGVQVVQVKATAVPAEGRIDFRWTTQREYPFQGFRVYRANDVAGSPGAFALKTPSLVAPAGDAVIQNDDNRQHYTFADNDPTLVVGQRYWYRVDWVDLLGTAHQELPVPVEYGTFSRVATAFYRIVHDAVDNDLLVRLGSDLDYTPGTLGQSNYEVLGPGESQQDSATVFLGLPGNPVTATLGSIEHYWSVGFKQGDGAEPYLPPSAAHPWFLHVTDAGYVNRTGRVTGFSLFVNDAPGSASGVTYVTNHFPLPQPTGEFGLTPAVLWIPEQGVTAVAVASFAANADVEGIRVKLELTQSDATTAMVYRGTSEAFESREALTAEAIDMPGGRLDYLDRGVTAGRTYYYWVEVREPNGAAYMNGPIAVTAGVAALTFASSPRPNPVHRETTFEYAVGPDVAAAGSDVSLKIFDAQGRAVKTLRSGPSTPGSFRTVWNVSDESGRSVPAGTYFLRFQAGKVAQTRLVTVVR